jgi:hypothetical protein
MYELHLNQGSLPYAKNRVSLMEFGLTWLQKKQSSETQKVVAVLLVLQG